MAQSKSRLWVAGCSFGIFDKDDTRPHWIRLVADQLGVDEIKNYSRGGADNDMIYFVADSILKNTDWPGRNGIEFNRETDYMIYLSTTNTRGWFRKTLFDDRSFDHSVGIANFDWWMNESNGKLLDEYDQFPDPLIYSQNYSTILDSREMHKHLVGNNKQLAGNLPQDELAIGHDKGRLSPEVLDIMTNYILLQDVDLKRKINQTQMEHMMTWAREQKFKIFFSHHDFAPIPQYDISKTQDHQKVSLELGMFEHPTDFEDVEGDGKNEQPNHLTDQAHLDYYNTYLEQRINDIINTRGWSQQ